jgi:hypothetical protein
MHRECCKSLLNLADQPFAGIVCCTNATSGENRLLPTKKILQLVDSHSTLT